MTPAGGIAGLNAVAYVSIIAIRRRPTDTDATRASIRSRTGVAVVAGGCVVRVDATSRRVAGIVRADVAIVAVRRRTTYTDAAGTGIRSRTGVTVIAWISIIREHADASRTGIRGTRIAIVAIGVDRALHTARDRRTDANAAGASVWIRA